MQLNDESLVGPLTIVVRKDIMRNLLKAFMLVLAFVVSIGFAGTASAEPTTWTPQLTQTARSAEADANDWAASLGNSSPGWAHIEQDQAACLEASAMYCFDDSVVYFRPSAIINWTNQVGYAGALFATGHEAAHHFQLLARHGSPGTTAHENQANCGAGVFLKRMVLKGRVADADVQRLIMKIQTGVRSAVHNPVELATAFNVGYSSGHLSTCVTPDSSIAGA